MADLGNPVLTLRVRLWNSVRLVFFDFDGLGEGYRPIVVEKNRHLLLLHTHTLAATQFFRKKE